MYTNIIIVTFPIRLDLVVFFRGSPDFITLTYFFHRLTHGTPNILMALLHYLGGREMCGNLKIVVPGYVFVSRQNIYFGKLRTMEAGCA